MLKGDLASTPLVPLLLQLAEENSTGCLHIADTEADEALIYFKTGLVYAVTVPGRRPQLGAKLVSSGALAPEALADALEAQRTELQGWRLGELLVHLGYVDQPVCEAFVKEQVQDSIWDLIRWPEGKWRFRKNEKTREDVAPPMAVTDLLGSLRERGVQWETISSVVHGPTAVPVLSTRGGGAPETTLDPDAWSMLCKIDGERTVAELARDCGYTLFEAGQVLVALVTAGLIDVEESVDLGPMGDELELDEVDAANDPDALYGATSVSSALVAEAADALASDEPAEAPDAFAELARLVTEVAASVRDGDDAPDDDGVVVDLPSQVSLRPQDDQSFAAALARVSSALSDVLGPAADNVDPFEVPTGLRTKRARTVVAKPESTPETERRQRVRAAAAAELAAAHALAEALRAAQADEVTTGAVEDVAFAEVVDLAVVRREAEEAARVEAERVAAEEARVEEARVEAERVAAEEARVEAERLEAERLEAERLAAEDAARVEAERLAAEEAARLEAERLEAERLAAEEAARLEAERLAAEEAARLEAERLAAEEAARLEAERLEAERLAAEEAARLEAERLEAERLAAEEAARLEAERAAAEEAERAAAQEAARLAAEEAARLEAERAAAEEAERAAAEEAARHAAEVAAAEDEAWTEYWQREGEAAEQSAARSSAASALLVELSQQAIEVEPEPVYDPAAAADEFDAPYEDDPEVREPAPVAAGYAMDEMTDTAALLRELSSLGVEDDPSPPSPAARAVQHRPSTAEPKKKKKIGLFGL